MLADVASTIAKCRTVGHAQRDIEEALGDSNHQAAPAKPDQSEYSSLVPSTQPKLPWCVKSQPSNGPRFAEFFAGIGLVRMGLEARGWNLAYANDLDPEKQEMYDAHSGDADEHFELTYVRMIDGAQLLDVELAPASFPCDGVNLVETAPT